MTRRSGWLVTSLVLIAGCATPNPATLPDKVRATAEAIDSARLATDVAYLASDNLGGRSTPSPGLDSAASYIVRRLAELELVPRGDSDTFLQHYSVQVSRRDTTDTWLEIGGQRFLEGKDFIVTNLGASTDVTAPMAYVGVGFRVPKKGIDDFAGITAKGRLLIANGPSLVPKGETFASLGSPGIDWEPTQIAADHLGAAGVVMMNPPRMVALWTRPFWHAMGLEDRRLAPEVPGAWSKIQPRFPVLWVKPNVASALLAGAPQGANAILAAAAKGDFAKSFDFPSTTMPTIHIGRAATTVLRPYNVVAMIEGRDRTLRGEYVLLGAHLDGAVESVGTPGDSIFNAADDNASGSAALLSIAEAMMRGPRPRRSVIFMWDTGEEVGLWGSSYFAANPPVPLDRIVTHFNVDMIGRSKGPGTSVEGEEELAGPNEIYVVGPHALSASLDSVLEGTSRDIPGLKLNHGFDKADHEWFYPRTDGAPFMERGVLKVDVLNGEHADYHRPSDESARLDVARMRRVTQWIFASAWMLAERRDRPVMDKEMPARVMRIP